MWQNAKNIYHLFQAILANIWYGFPARDLKVIGVTGTDGKTTTASLIYHILKNSGEKAALISTVGAYIADKHYDVGFHVTNPASFPLQKYIKKAKDLGVKYLVLEVTSHGLDQNRVWGIPFKIGVLTNITHEHLDYHKTYEEYMNTKLKLLAGSRWRIVNKDDNSYSLIKFRNNIITYSLVDQSTDINLKNFPFKTNLIGEFNKSNCLAAVAACRLLNIDDEKIRKALVDFKPPKGRLEVVYDKEFKVIIDFAHTPNSFAKVLPEVKKITISRLIHVFGSAGLRDASKRSKMGQVSAKYANIIILTAEDPRVEKIAAINTQIKSGINIKDLIEIDNRKEAIEAAIKMAKRGDTVILTGKAHEKSINYGRGEEPWDEFETVKKALKKR